MNPTYYQYQVGATPGFQQFAYYQTTQYNGGPSMTAGRVQVALQPPPPPPPTSSNQVSAVETASSAVSTTVSSSDTLETNTTTTSSDSAVLTTTTDSSQSTCASDERTNLSQTATYTSCAANNMTGQVMMPPTQHQSQLAGSFYTGAYVQQAQPQAQLSFVPQSQPFYASSQYSALGQQRIMYIPAPMYHSNQVGKQHASYVIPAAAPNLVPAVPGSTLVQDPNTGMTYLLNGFQHSMTSPCQFQSMSFKPAARVGGGQQQYFVAAPPHYQHYHQPPYSYANAHNGVGGKSGVTEVGGQVSVVPAPTAAGNSNQAAYPYM